MLGRNGRRERRNFASCFASSSSISSLDRMMRLKPMLKRKEAESEVEHQDGRFGLVIFASPISSMITGFVPQYSLQKLVRAKASKSTRNLEIWTLEVG